MIKNTIIETVEEVCSNITSQDVEFKHQYRQGVICYDRLAFKDEDSVPDLVTFGFIRGASEALVESFIPTVANQVVATQSRLFVPADYRPFVRVKGGDANDTLTLYVYGYVSDNG